MKIISAVLLFVLAAMALAQPENRELRREMERFYERWDNAIENTSVMNLVEPDFYQVDKQGHRVGLGGFEDQMRAMMRGNNSASTTVMNVRQGYNEAVAWIKTTYSWGNGKTLTQRIAHTLRRTPSGWKVYYSQILPDNETWGPPPTK